MSRTSLLILRQAWYCRNAGKAVLGLHASEDLAADALAKHLCCRKGREALFREGHDGRLQSNSSRANRTKARALFTHVFAAYKLAAQKSRKPISSFWPKDLSDIHEFLSSAKGRQTFKQWSPGIRVTYYIWRFPAYRKLLVQLVSQARRRRLSGVEEMVPSQLIPIECVHISFLGNCPCIRCEFRLNAPSCARLSRQG